MVALAVVALTSGCVVGPDFRRPDAPEVDGYARPSLASKTASTEIVAGGTQRFMQGQDIVHDWWTLFQSPELNALIDRALKANPTMVAAQAALRQAMELVYAQQGRVLPHP